MQVDFTQVLKSVKHPGESLEEFELYSNPNFESTEMTPDEPMKHTRKVIINLRQACLSGLTGNFKSDREVSGKEKYKQHILAEKIQQKDVVDLTSQEITMCKDRIGLAYGAEVVGPAWTAIDPIKDNKGE